MSRTLGFLFIGLIMCGCTVQRTGLSETELSARDKRVKAVGARIFAAGNEICQQFHPDSPRCNVDATLVDMTVVDVGTAMGNVSFGNAETKNYVLVTAATLDIVQHDSELALLIAHEYAHSVLGHLLAKTSAASGLLARFVTGIAGTTITRKDKSVGPSASKKLVTGLFGGSGYSESEELDADYFSFYLLARAGYAVSEALDIWNTPANEKTRFYFATTHLVTENRAALARKTMDEISLKQRRRQPLLPEIQ